MGDAQSLPVVGEAVTAVEFGAKSVAAGACALVGETDAAEKLAEGAVNSLKEYTEKNIIVGPINATIQAATGNEKEGERILRKTARSLEGVVDGTPGLGHVKGAIHFAAGDEEHGKKCMLKASRTTAVVGAGMLTGGLGGGAVLAGSMGTGAGIYYDTMESAVREKPTGTLKGIDEAIKTNDPSRIVDTALGAAGDFAGGCAGAHALQALEAGNCSVALGASYQAVGTTQHGIFMGNKNFR